MKYIINEIPKSLNHYAGRKNPWEYRQDKEKWKIIVMLTCRQRPPKPYEKARVTITYYFPTRARRDPDNYTPKFLLDGLTAAGIIKDDSFQCIELTVRGEYDKERPRTEIEVTEE